MKTLICTSDEDDKGEYITTWITPDNHVVICQFDLELGTHEGTQIRVDADNILALTTQLKQLLGKIILTDEVDA